MKVLEVEVEALVVPVEELKLMQVEEVYLLLQDQKENEEGLEQLAEILVW